MINFPLVARNEIPMLKYLRNVKTNKEQHKQGRWKKTKKKKKKTKKKRYTWTGRKLV